MKTKLKQTNGITLIALIITIIILLILAMVTIRILMNQGIIKHAQNATAAYKDAQNNETEYLTYAEGEMDKYAGGGSEKSEEAELGPEELRKYLLGADLTGRSMREILNLDMNRAQNTKFIDKDDEGGITSASEKIKLLNVYAYTLDFGKEDGLVFAFYVKYNGAAYKVITKGTRVDNLTTEPSTDVVKVYEPRQNGKEGTIVQYSADGSTTKTDWLVLYDNGNTLDIISVNTMGGLFLGKEDTSATNDTNDSDEDLGKAINSYNNAYTRINNYCKSLVTNPTAQNVRSVGSKPDFSSTDTTATYSSANLETWVEHRYNNIGKDCDTNAESDIIRMSFYDKVGATFGYAESDNAYWLASRIVEEYSMTKFFVRAVRYNGFVHLDVLDGLYTYGLWGVRSDKAITSYSSGKPVRPVVRVAVSDVS